MKCYHIHPGSCHLNDNIVTIPRVIVITNGGKQEMVQYFVQGLLMAPSGTSLSS